MIRRHARTRVESVLIRAKSTCVLVTGTRGGSTDKGLALWERERAGRSILALFGLLCYAFPSFSFSPPFFFFFSNSHAHHVRANALCVDHTHACAHTPTLLNRLFFLCNRSRFVVVSHAVVMKTMAYNTLYALYAIRNCAHLSTILCDNTKTRKRQKVNKQKTNKKTLILIRHENKNK